MRLHPATTKVHKSPPAAWQAATEPPKTAQEALASIHRQMAAAGEPVPGASLTAKEQAAPALISFEVHSRK